MLVLFFFFLRHYVNMQQQITVWIQRFVVQTSNVDLTAVLLANSVRVKQHGNKRWKKTVLSANQLAVRNAA